MKRIEVFWEQKKKESGTEKQKEKQREPNLTKAVTENQKEREKETHIKWERSDDISGKRLKSIISSYKWVREKNWKDYFAQKI